MRSSFLMFLGATLLVAAMAQPAVAATPTPSLAGEQFASTTTPFPPGFGGSATVIAKTCGPDGTGSLSFTADGNATGPYPGTFHEDGIIDLVGGVVTRADARFTILSAAGAVSGTKSFNTSANPADSAGNCAVEPSSIDPNNFLNFFSQQQQTYTATITNAQGQFGDSGSGGSVFQTAFQDVTLNPQFMNTFTEGFQVSNGVTTTVSPTITTQATASAHMGGSFSDSANLSGGNAPTGTITFNVFDPSNDTCTGFAFFQSTMPVSGNGIYTSDTFPAFFAVGAWRWVVVYSGDAKNNSFTTACNDPAETTTITLTSPTITTSATTANTPGPISDTATLAGGFVPTGTITFSLFAIGDTTCSGTPLLSLKTVSDNGSYTSDPFPAALPGTYRWIAAYSGDGFNNPATTACNDSGEISVVTKTTPSITTQAIASVTIGDLISDTATLSGGNAPVGTISFQVFGPNDPTCLAPLFQSFKTVTGNRSYTSDVVKVRLPGTYRWVATYLGDKDNNPATTACGDTGEISIVKANPTITTQATASAVVGGTISDIATLDGGVAPTGTITFSLFGTTDCSGTALFVSTTPVNGNGLYASAAFTPAAPGTYRWVVSYDGDASNNGTTTACGDAGEASTVIKASPTISTQATASALMGGSISDTATLLGASVPTGAITFSLFRTTDCSGTPLFVSTTPVNGTGPSYDSAPFFPPAPAFYNWVAAYSGDGNNNAATTACGDANETSIVSRVTPTISTQATASLTVGAGIISDTATLSGGIAPTGTITFSLFGTPNCSGTALFFSTIPVNGNGPGYDSAPFVPSAPGTYNWVAAYSGDGNNTAATTLCGDPNESSIVVKATPTISTQATASLTMGAGIISDTATLSGGNVPTGTITFSLFGTPNCSGTALLISVTPVNGNGSGYDSAPFLPAVPGTYNWVAAYSGDGNNNAATTLCGDPNESSIVVKASPTISTQATASLTIGAGVISDTATLSGGNVPTGTITFSLFGTPNCSGTALFTSTTLVNGNGPGYDSGPFVPAVPGTYNWVAAYSGDGNNNAATTVCGDPNESSVVTKASPTISTQAIASATMGGSISDTATLLGGNVPTGAITFSLFGTADCSGTPLFFSTAPVNGNGPGYNSAPFFPPAPGTYNWVAAYSGDGNNNAATTVCNDPNEISVVSKASLAIFTAATASANMGGSISDTATLLGGNAPTGAIAFSLFGTADCSGTALFFSTTPVNGNGPGYNSAPFFPPAPGTYRWIAAYSGDANNNGATTVCNDPNEVSVVTKASPAISTQATVSAYTGGIISDTAILSAGNAPTGAITFSVFGTADCSGTALSVSTKTVTDNGTFSSDAFTPLAPGSYNWVAAYSGDPNNNGATTVCNDPNETSTVTNKTTPTISTQATALADPGAGISDTATLSAGNAPTGAIRFSVFGTADCSGTVLFVSTKTVTDNGTYLSDAFIPASPGTYRWIASYSGDANNNSATTLCNDPGETSTVTTNKANPTISTRATVSANPGGPISDTAILAAGNSPTGAIIFNLFGPGDVACTGTPIFTSSKTVTGNGTYSSDSFSSTSPGTYRWVAAYSGDPNNNAATTLCNDAGETSTVSNKTSPTISTEATETANPGGAISDTAILAEGNAPTGTIIFNLYGASDPSCTGTPIFTSSKTVTGNGTYTSASFSPASPGTYRWIAAYTGDAGNNAATTLCNDPGETSTVTKVSPEITTQATASANTGGAISDTATISEGNAPTGAITFNLFGPNNANCSGTPIFTSSKTVSGNGTYRSAPFTAVQPGTYRWVALYSGDPTNNAATSACNDAGETSTVNRVIAPDVKLTLITAGGFSTGHVGAYIVIVTNTGTVPTSGTLTFTDTLPAGLTYAGSFTLGWTCSVASQTVTCTYAHPLPVGGITGLALFVHVTAPGGTVLTDIGTVTPSDATPADNTASVTVTVWQSRRYEDFGSRSSGNSESGDNSQRGR